MPAPFWESSLRVHGLIRKISDARVGRKIIARSKNLFRVVYSFTKRTGGRFLIIFLALTNCFSEIARRSSKYDSQVDIECLFFASPRRSRLSILVL